jgi:nitrous oxidase accessory protein NosD
MTVPRSDRSLPRVLTGVGLPLLVIGAGLALLYVALFPPGRGPAPTTRVPTTWAVAADGSDEAAGTTDAPFLTVQHAVDISLPGDTVQLAPGRYDGFVVRLAATQAAPLTILGAADGATTVVGSDALPNTVRITGAASHVALEDLTITGSTGYRNAGVLVESVEGPIELRRLRLIDNPGFGLNVYQSKDVLLESSEVAGNGTGVQVAGDGAGVVIQDNEIHDNDLMIRNTPKSEADNDDYGAVGVSLSKTTGPVLVTRNRISGNRAASFDYAWDGGAVEIFGASGVTVTENTIWDNEGVVETGTDGSSPCSGNRFVRNVAWGEPTRGRSPGLLLRCGDGMLIAHNTLWDLTDWSLLVRASGAYAGSIEGARIMGNVFAMQGEDAVYDLTPNLPESLVIDDNLLWNPGGAGLARIGGVSIPVIDSLRAPGGYELHGLHADPRFVDAATHDLHLAADSPAIDAGVAIEGLVEAHEGAAPDLGRWETPAR